MRSLAAMLSALLLLAGGGVSSARGEGTNVLHSAPKMGVLKYRVLIAKNVAKNVAKKAKEAKCDVIEFHATKSGTKSVDAKLDKWKAELEQPPLSAFDTFKVTEAKTVTIAKDASANVKITANVSLLFKGFTTENDKDRLQLEVTIDNAKGKRMYRSTTTQDSGASQILSAGKHAAANVFFVVTCTAQ